MGEQIFPNYFAELGHEAPTRNIQEKIQSTLRQVMKGREMMPHKIQIEFEKADLKNDEDWFVNHWDSYKFGMVYHALASFGAFFWTHFRHWLNKISEKDDSAKETLDLFRRHPNFMKEN